MQILYFHDERGVLLSLPASWTSFAAKDPFVEQAAGRCHFRFEDLRELSAMLQQLGARLASDAGD